MKEKTKYYYLELPKGYVKQKVIDAKKTSTAIIFTLVSFVMAFAVIFLLMSIKKFSINDFASDRLRAAGSMLIMIVSYIAYIIIHELTHGIGYKLFTREKLKFGVTLTCAFCGVPNAYVKKWPAFITTLLPFTVYTIIFLPICLITNNIDVLFIFGLLFAFHFAGCVGDLYVALYLLFVAPKDVLVNDDGAKQEFYVFSEKKYQEALAKENNEATLPSES